MIGSSAFLAILNNKHPEDKFVVLCNVLICVVGLLSLLFFAWDILVNGN